MVADDEWLIENRILLDCFPHRLHLFIHLIMARLSRIVLAGVPHHVFAHVRGYLAQAPPPQAPRSKTPSPAATRADGTEIRRRIIFGLRFG